MNLFGFGKQFDNSSPAPQMPKGIMGFISMLLAELWTLIKLNLLYLLVCLPVLTIGPATAGMNYVLMKLWRGDGVAVWSDFWKGFKDNWKPSILVGLACGLILTSFYLSVWIIIVQQQMLFLFLAVILLTVLCTGQLYLFPMLVTVDLPLPMIFRNAFILGVSCLPQALLGFILSQGVLVAMLLFFPYTLPLIPFLCFSVSQFIATFAAYAGLKKHVIRENHPEEDY